MDPRIGFVTQVDLSLEGQLERAGEAGFDYVEIMLDGPTNRETLAERGDEIEDSLAAAGLDLLVHLPFPTDIGSPHEHVRAGAVEEQTACIEAASNLGAEKGVLHPESSAWSGAWDAETLRDHVDSSVRELTAYGADRGFEVCAENLFDNYYEIDTIDRLLAETDVSMTLDTGHARITGYDESEVAGFVEAHADRVRHVHLNDTRFAADEHLPYGVGNLDFETILGAFPADWDGTLSLEINVDDFEHVVASKERLEGTLDTLG
jgi:sugar phosphate isomerase/epimerase